MEIARGLNFGLESFVCDGYDKLGKQRKIIVCLNVFVLRFWKGDSLILSSIICHTKYRMADGKF